MEISKDGYHIVVQNENKITIFNEIRASVIWGNSGKPHYFAIYGLSNNQTADKHDKIILIMEKQCTDLNEFFRGLIAGVTKWHVVQIWGSEKDQILITKMARFLQKQWELKHFNWCDSEEFPKMEDNIPVIQEWVSRGAVTIPQKSIIGSQIGHIETDDLTDKNGFYAVEALSDIISSYEFFPWMKPQGSSVNRHRRDGYGS